MRQLWGYRKSSLVRDTCIAPLPQVRKRSLTAPLPLAETKSLGIIRTRQRTIEQLASRLCMLPLEIRSLIFEFVLFGGRNVVHIYQRRKRISHWRCTNQTSSGEPCTYKNPCSPALPFKSMELDDNGHFLSGNPSLMPFYDNNRVAYTSHVWSVINLLRTCRLVYTEVIPMLYEKTHFHFPHPSDLTLFSKSVLPHRLDTIRILSLDVGEFDTGLAISPTGQVKEGTSTMTSGLSGLKELRVFVKKAVATRELARAGLGLGYGIKEQEGLRIFQVVVSRDQKSFWDEVMNGKDGVDVVCYRDDPVVQVVEATEEAVVDDTHDGSWNDYFGNLG